MTTQTRRSTTNSARSSGESRSGNGRGDKAERTRTTARPRSPSRSSAQSPARPRKTKRDQLIGMLQAPGGADIARISRKLGWQPHTTRAALTGLRKAGFTIERSTSGVNGNSIYRIAAEPTVERQQEPAE